MVYRKWTLVVGVLLILSVLTLYSFPARLFAEQHACSPTSFVSQAAGPVYSRDGQVLWTTDPGTRYCIVGIGEPTWVLIHREEDPDSMGWRRFSQQAYDRLWDSLLVTPRAERDQANERARQLLQERATLTAERGALAAQVAVLKAAVDRLLTGGPSLELLDVIGLTARQIGDGGSFPEGARRVRCIDAQYRSGNGMWAVRCEFRWNQWDTSPVATRTYLLNDQTGSLSP